MTPSIDPEGVADLIHGDRQREYGDYSENSARCADLWTVWLSGRSRITQSDITGMMILLKLSRLANNPWHEDSWKDISGYAMLQTGQEIPDGVPGVPCDHCYYPLPDMAGSRCASCGDTKPWSDRAEDG